MTKKKQLIQDILGSILHCVPAFLVLVYGMNGITSQMNLDDYCEHNDLGRARLYSTVWMNPQCYDDSHWHSSPIITDVNHMKFEEYEKNIKKRNEPVYNKEKDETIYKVENK